MADYNPHAIRSKACSKQELQFFPIWIFELTILIYFVCENICMYTCTQYSCVHNLLKDFFAAKVPSTMQILFFLPCPIYGRKIIHSTFLFLKLSFCEKNFRKSLSFKSILHIFPTASSFELQLFNVNSLMPRQRISRSSPGELLLNTRKQ